MISRVKCFFLWGVSSQDSEEVKVPDVIASIRMIDPELILTCPRVFRPDLHRENLKVHCAESAITELS